MKKRQIGLFGLIIGQAVTMVAKDKKLRNEVQSAPGFLQKLKVFWSKRRETNKELVEEVSENAKDWDWNKSVETIKSNIDKDSETVQQRWAAQEGKDRENQWKESVRKIIAKAPSQKSLEETLQKYKQKILDRRENI
jgi:hypothetical protein